MKKTRLLSFLLAIMMIVGTLAIIPVTASANAWDGETKTQPAGEGTKEKPFLIATAENLAWVSYMTKNFTELNDAIGAEFVSGTVFDDMYFVQTADIDLGGHEFEPIGFTQADDAEKRNAFAGHYDGRGYKISNAVIKPESQVKKTVYGDFMEAGYHPGGIFGVIAAGSTISNVNACNVKVGEIKTNSMLRNRIYTLTVAGVIVGTTYGSATISNCTTDASCEVYGFFAAGGILGVPEMGAYITECVNQAKVASCTAAGGIVGQGFNTDISYCLNKGSVQNYTPDRWTGVGGIMGSLMASSRNKSNTITYCVNAADAAVGAVSFQDGAQSNRIAVGGITGTDNTCATADLTYSYCYNLQNSFTVKFLDNGGSAQNYLILAGGIAGYAKDNASAGTRVFDHCYSVDANYTYDWTALAAATVNGQSEKTKSFNCNWNEQSADPTNVQPYAGIVGAEMSVKQVTDGIGDPTTAFATCQYGITPEAIAEQAEYQAILSILATNAAIAEAPKYVGVQETLDKSAGNYELRFVLATNRTDYHQAGVEVTVSYGEGQMKSFVLTADKYHDSLSGKKADGKGVNYFAASFGAEKLMALKLAVDLATYGAATYSVTPFFVESEGGEAAYGRTWTVNYAADGSFVGQSIVEPEPENDDTALYTIVYPENSVMAPAYTVVGLQYHILSKRGIKMPLATQRSTDPDAYEIVIVEDDTMETGSFSTAVEGNSLIVTAGDTFGYIAAAQRLTKHLFSSGRIKLSEECNTTGVYEREMISEKNGETRVIFQNVWYRDTSANSPLFASITGIEYQLALVALYQPDVIGLNEFFGDGWHTSGFSEAMAEIGYLEVIPERPDGTPAKINNPIFYNTATTEYVEGSSKYLSYGAYHTSDVDGDGIMEPVRYNTGEFAGRYYDNSDNLGSTANVATFKDKTSEKEYTVCCTHLESNTYVDPQIAPLGNPLRMEQVEKLIPFLRAYQAEYGKTILVGGDYNSADSYEAATYRAKGDDKGWPFAWESEDPSVLTEYDWHDGTKKPYLWGACDELRANGFINCRNETLDTAHNHSCNGYPEWSSELNAYVGFSANLKDDAGSSDYAGSIDHIYALEVYENELETVRYRNLSIETILSSSDHKPVMIDFNVVVGGNGNPGGGTTGGNTDYTDNDMEGATWQGMNDYAAPTQGSGTEADPYLIERPEHLAWLARATNDAAWASAFLGTEQTSRRTFLGVYFKQTADIDLAGLAFTPIGDYQSSSNYTKRHGFAGIYDGDGYAIKNATINANKDRGNFSTEGFDSDTYVSGIFGLISNNAVIQNVNAKNIKVGELLNENGTLSAQTFGETFAGVIVGVALEATVTGCTTDADCSAIGVYAGGVVAFQSKATDLSYCVNRASVLGNKAAGGIVGAAEANTIAYNVNYADISAIVFGRWHGVGGIIGVYSAQNKDIANAVSNCINYGAMSADDRSIESQKNHRVGLGGIVGNDNTGIQTSYENCFNLANKFTAKVVHVADTQKSFLACGGGISGYARDGAATRSYTNCYSVAGSSTVDNFGTVADEDWTAGNGSAYAGTVTGYMNDTQVTKSLKNDANASADTAALNAAFASCYYGVDATEIEANETYLAILAALEG